MDDRWVARCAGGCAVGGGCSWLAAVLTHAAQPRGCIGAECETMPMRDATSGTGWLVAIATVLLLASGAALLVLIRRQARLGWTGGLGAASCAIGVAVLALGSALQSLFFAGDFPLMPLFVLSGVPAFAAGGVLLGWTVLRSRVLPMWSGLSLLLGALFLLGADEQTSVVLFAAPLGLAWVAIGVNLLLRGVRVPSGARDSLVPVSDALVTRTRSRRSSWRPGAGRGRRSVS